MDYTHYPLNGNFTDSGNAGFPALSTSSITGVWDNAGYFTGNGSAEITTGDDTTVKNFFDLSTLGDGLIIVAAWIKSSDWSTISGSGNMLFSYASSNAGPGFKTRVLRTGGGQTRVQAQYKNQSGPDILNTQDLRNIEDENTSGSVFVLVCFRNRGGVIEECVLVDGIQTWITILEGDVWANTGNYLQHGFNIGSERTGAGAFQGFWRSGDMMKDVICVRSSNDVWSKLDILARDAWNAGGGIPQSWFDAL